MAGGIQVGTTAWDSASLRHDRIVREASKEAEKILQERYPDIKRHHKVLKDSLPTKTGACSPDGGAWYYKDKFVAAFEAKKQGPRGNAIERWYKNYFLVSQLNARCPLVTYAIGEGVREGNPIHVILHAAHGGEYNPNKAKNIADSFEMRKGFVVQKSKRKHRQFDVFRID